MPRRLKRCSQKTSNAQGVETGRELRNREQGLLAASCLWAGRPGTGSHRRSLQHAPSRGITRTDSPRERGHSGRHVTRAPRGMISMWHDNETDRDFLNFTGVAATVAELIGQAKQRISYQSDKEVQPQRRVLHIPPDRLIGGHLQQAPDYSSKIEGPITTLQMRNSAPGLGP